VGQQVAVPLDGPGGSREDGLVLAELDPEHIEPATNFTLSADRTRARNCSLSLFSMRVVMMTLRGACTCTCARATHQRNNLKVMSNVGWGSVRATTGVRLGDVGRTFYYEACVELGGLVQVGWATKRFRAGASDGVGDDR
jgi:hypothetical protein